MRNISLQKELKDVKILNRIYMMKSVGLKDSINYEREQIKNYV